MIIQRLLPERNHDIQDEMPTIECTIVEVVVFKKSKGAPLYLMLRRSSTEKLYPDTWQIVTGTIETGESALTAALREVDEETSLQIRKFWSVPALDLFFDVKSDSVQLCPLFAGEVDGDAVPTLSEEHQHFRWVGIEEAFKSLVWPGHHKAIETVHQFIVAEREAARLTEINHAIVERKSL